MEGDGQTQVGSRISLNAFSTQPHSRSYPASTPDQLPASANPLSVVELVAHRFVGPHQFRLTTAFPVQPWSTRYCRVLPRSQNEAARVDKLNYFSRLFSPAITKHWVLSGSSTAFTMTQSHTCSAETRFVGILSTTNCQSISRRLTG